MWELDCKETWALKNWCFWTVVLEETLESLWTARKANQSILKKISPEYSLEGLMLKLKLQYFGHLMQRSDSFEKTLLLRKIEGGKIGVNRGYGSMASSTQWTWVVLPLGVGDGQGELAWGHNESDMTELLNWTEPKRVRQKSVGNRLAWWKDPGTSMMLWNCWINQP